jgi:hypothetical protein
MNERIRQLVEQAGAVFTDVHAVSLLDDEIEKFAELIVRECMKICKDHPSIIFKNEWDADVVSPDIVSRLESHFGVDC